MHDKKNEIDNKVQKLLAKYPTYQDEDKVLISSDIMNSFHLLFIESIEARAKNAMKSLLDAGLQLDKINETSGFVEKGSALMHYVIDYPWVMKFLASEGVFKKEGFNIDVLNSNEKTALSLMLDNYYKNGYAVECEYVIYRLLEAGAYINNTLQDPIFSLFIRNLNTNSMMKSLLDAGLQLDKINETSGFVEKGSALIHYIAYRIDTLPQTILFLASEGVFKKEGFNINVLNSNGKTALDIVLEEINTHIGRMALMRYVPCMKTLLEAGAKPKQLNKEQLKIPHFIHNSAYCIDEIIDNAKNSDHAVWIAQAILESSIAYLHLLAKYKRETIEALLSSIIDKIQIAKHRRNKISNDDEKFVNANVMLYQEMVYTFLHDTIQESSEQNVLELIKAIENDSRSKQEIPNLWISVLVKNPLEKYTLGKYTEHENLIELAAKKNDINIVVILLNSLMPYIISNRENESNINIKQDPKKAEIADILKEANLDYSQLKGALPQQTYNALVSLTSQIVQPKSEENSLVSVLSDAPAAADVAPAVAPPTPAPTVASPTPPAPTPSSAVMPAASPTAKPDAAKPLLSSDRKGSKDSNNQQTFFSYCYSYLKPCINISMNALNALYHFVSAIVGTFCQR